MQREEYIAAKKCEKTPDLAKDLVLKGVLSLEDVIPDWIDEEMAFAAIENFDGMQLQYVPKKYRTQEVCLKAVTDNGIALRYVPEGLRRERNIIFRALHETPWAILYVRNPEWRYILQILHSFDMLTPKKEKIDWHTKDFEPLYKVIMAAIERNPGRKKEIPERFLRDFTPNGALWPGCKVKVKRKCGPFDSDFVWTTDKNWTLGKIGLVIETKKEASTGIPLAKVYIRTRKCGHSYWYPSDCLEKI